MQVPGRAVAEGDALNGDILAVAQVEEARAVRAGFDLVVLGPPLRVLGAAVHDALADDPHVLDPDAGQGGGVGIQGVAFPAAQKYLALLVRGAGHARQHREPPHVRGQAEYGVRLQLQGDAALEEERPGQVLSPGDQHAPALGAAQDRRLQRGGIVGLPVALRAEAPDVKGADLRLRPHGQALFLPALHGQGQLVLRIRPQAEERHDRPPAVIHQAAVQRQGIGLTGIKIPLFVHQDRAAAGRDE